MSSNQVQRLRVMTRSTGAMACLYILSLSPPILTSCPHPRAWFIRREGGELGEHAGREDVAGPRLGRLRTEQG